MKAYNSGDQTRLKLDYNDRIDHETKKLADDLHEQLLGSDEHTM